ncbi:hypothetical protein ABIA33_000568 [Streptacidiphilus sp. MAP12-16]|uniref:hypothetical protein n=1 Tax=Streptacidiphilus sp. MAP12-16 TaxID=3156300 RepID=UPI0035176EEC
MDTEFEDRIGQAFRRAGQGYDIEPQPLLARGLRRGHSLRRRRVGYTVVGTVAALALVGGVPALFFGRTDGPKQVAVTTGGSPSFSGQQILDLLKRALPPGQISQAWAKGAGGGRPADFGVQAHLIFDDGHGAASLDLGSAPTSNGNVLAATTCSPDNPPVGGTCEQTTLADGSTVAIEKISYGGSAGKPASLQWNVSLVTRKGEHLWLDENNSTVGGPGAKTTRSAPPLSAAQLTALVEDRDWSRLFAALRTARPDHQPSQAQVLATLRQVLPPGVHPGGNNAMNQEGSAAVPVNALGSDQLSVNVQRWPGDARSEIAAANFAGANRLADGTLTAVDHRPARPDAGIATWEVRVLRPDGTMVSLTEEQMEPGRPTAAGPTLSLDQLKAMAMSPKWTG